MNLAHVKWFVEDPSTKIPEISAGEIVFVFIFVISGLCIAYFVDRFIKQQKSIAEVSDKIQPLRNWMPTIIRLILAIMLAYSSINRTVFAPNLIADNQLSGFLVVLTSLISALLLLGLATRASAVALIATFVAAAINFGPLNLLDHAEIVGLSLFLLIEGPGKWAFDNTLIKSRKYALKYRKHSMRIILVSAGISFASLAFSEKLGDLNLAAAFLNDHNWNFLSFAGVSDRNFILFIGASELAIGLSLIVGLANRAVVMLLLLILITTAVLLGISEVVGHAFAVAVVAAAWLIHDLPLMNTRQR
jgi:uncharacterized membrane protein YphA (DoxX/SURF4 family)